MCLLGSATALGLMFGVPLYEMSYVGLVIFYSSFMHGPEIEHQSLLGRATASRIDVWCPVVRVARSKSEKAPFARYTRFLAVIAALYVAISVGLSVCP